MNDLSEFIQTIRNQLKRVTSETDIAYTRFKTSKELVSSLNGDLKELQEGNMDKFQILYSHFLPTSTFHELSINGGWEEEYLDIADRMDELYMRLKPRDTENKDQFRQFLKRIKSLK